MIELIGYSFHSINLIPTCLVLLTLIYWFFVILGALDMGFLDFDLEADGEADIDLNADIDMEVDGGDADIDGGVSPIFIVLGFFNIGKIPIMLFVTLLSIPMWFIAIVGNHYLGITSFIIGLGLLVPNFFVSLFVAKFISTPFVHIFKKISNNEEDNFSPIGKKCVTKYNITSDKLGQAVVTSLKGKTHLINVKTYDNKVIKKGGTGLVIDYNKEKKIYMIDPYSED